MIQISNGVHISATTPFKVGFVKLYKTNVIPHAETIVALYKKD